MMALNNQHLLTPFFSNTDKNVFYLKNLPPVLKGALFSRYSRSTKPLRELFLEDYLQTDELDLNEITDLTESLEKLDTLLNTEKAQKFYSKWLAMYGDDSIAELGAVHVGIENISVVATKALEDRRIGLSPLEKSTRYVRFDEKINGHYQYYRDPDILASVHKDDYLETMDYLFDTYSSLIEPMTAYFQKEFPKPDDVKESAYTASIRAKACDTLRGLLPMGTLTNMGIMGNGRAWEYAITRLLADPLPEAQRLGEELYNELAKVIFNFVERIKTEKGELYHAYLNNTHAAIERSVQEVMPQAEFEDTTKTILHDFDKDAVNKTIASIFFAHSEVGYESCYRRAKDLSDAEKTRVIDTYVSQRNGRWHKVGSAFEEVYYSFEILADLGTYKDLQRHRILSRYRQRFTTNHGYEIPDHIIRAGFEESYRKALDIASETYLLIESEFPYQSQYLVCHGHRGRWRLKMNLREAFHLCELRSSPQGHPNYRLVAQEMHRKITEVHPILGNAMKYVDHSDPGLERLSSEIRKRDKLEMMGHSVE